MISCLIIDDDEMFLELMKHFVLKHPDLQLAGCYSSAIDASEALASQNVDLILLDIEMPEVNGIELIKTAKIIPQVIFVTAHTEYAAEAFEYDVTDYIVKPVSEQRFLKAIEKAVNITKYQELVAESEHLYIKVDSNLVKIPTNNITSVQAFGDYIKLYEGSNRHIILGTLNSMQNTLNPDKFMRIHRKFIIRIDAVTSISGYDVHLEDGRIVQVSRSMKAEITALLKKG